VTKKLFTWSLFRLLLAAALLAAGRGLDLLAGFRTFTTVPGLAIVAILLGALLCARAARELHDAGPNRLAEGGPYHFVRHPLSLGFQLALLGVALLLASPGCLLAAGPLLFALWLGQALLVEEPALARRFGVVYARYRLETGFAFPSLYVWSMRVLHLVYRIGYGVRIHSLERVPHSGPFFLIGLHRTYMDPYIIAFRVPRKVHYMATSVLFRHRLIALYFRKMGCIPLIRSRPDLRPIMEALKTLDVGGVVGMYPEGARSWYGETACEPAVFKLLQKRKVPIVTVELIGAFEYYPRFTRRQRRRPVCLKYRLYPAGTQDPLGLMEALANREHRRDALLRAQARPQPARAAEQLVYICPRCSTPFRCRGYKDGSIRCRACGARFTLLEGKGLLLPGGGSLSLPELERRNLSWAGGYEPGGQLITGALLCRCSVTGKTDLQTCRRLRRADMRCVRPGALSLFPDHLIAGYSDGNKDRWTVRYEEMQSVLVESNWKLEFSFRKKEGQRGYLFFLPPLRYALFLQHFLRLKAFGNPYARYRGSRRFDILPS